MIKEIKYFIASSLLAFSFGSSSAVLSLLFMAPTNNVLAQPATTNKTVPFVLRKFLGCKRFCEAIVVNQNTGKIYKLLYYNTIKTPQSTEVMIEMGNYAYNWSTYKWYRRNGENWYRIINPRTGRWSLIYSVQVIE